MIQGTGIDIIEISRIKKAIDRWGERFLKYVFTEKEIKYAMRYKYPEQHFAGRFAAKEAVYKAIGDSPDISWQDLEILNDEHGRPFCFCRKKDFRYKILVSISHTSSYAAANAIIVEG